ncbi:MAG: ABC transporter substrate-binding protein [Acidobacteria bacterium]|nr:ABC transporter substrate-binding protein [Acidobacteriota bacterium]
MTTNTIRIMASRHSAFYSPLLSTIAAGFLREEGFESTYEVLSPGSDAQELIRDGKIDIVQSAVSSSWARLEKNEGNLAVHFAQINQRDGFFLTGRRPEPSFNWKMLEGASLLADHGAQPLAMLKYAAHQNGVDWNKIKVIDAGSVEEIDGAFRSGLGDFVHQQGPAPQQLEREGIGHIVASVGEAMPAVAFSSLMASREFLKTGASIAFIRGYSRAREWVNQAPPDEIAGAEIEFFSQIDREVLATTIARYQALRCWDGEITITHELYEQALNVFLHSGIISRRHPYESVVAPSFMANHL